MKNVFVILMVMVAGFMFAQKTYTLQSKPALSVSGTSTLHDWEMPSSTATGTMKATVSGNTVSAIQDVNVTMKANTIKSGKAAMDKKAYEALKTDKFPNATFELTSAKKSGSNWAFSGYFTFAGKKKAVNLTVQESTSNGVINLSGSHSFNLTDYGIEPPTALMGTIKTGNKVTVKFNLKFK